MLIRWEIRVAFSAALYSQSYRMLPILPFTLPRSVYVYVSSSLRLSYISVTLLPLSFDRGSSSHGCLCSSPGSSYEKKSQTSNWTFCPPAPHNDRSLPSVQSLKIQYSVHGQSFLVGLLLSELFLFLSVFHHHRIIDFLFYPELEVNCAYTTISEAEATYIFYNPEWSKCFSPITANSEFTWDTRIRMYAETCKSPFPYWYLARTQHVVNHFNFFRLFYWYGMDVYSLCKLSKIYKQGKPLN